MNLFSETSCLVNFSPYGVFPHSILTCLLMILEVNTRHNLPSSQSVNAVKTAGGQCITPVNSIMSCENAPKDMVKSFIDLANMAKRLIDENLQPCVQQKLERLFPSTRGGGRGVENSYLYRVGACESTTSTTTDANISFAKPSTTKRTIAEIWGSKTWGDSQ